jgi:PDZ domain-containing secreted protein
MRPAVRSFLNKPLGYRILRGFLLAAAVSLLAAFAPTPYHLTAPGQAENVGPMVSINKRTFASQGCFILPTVISEPATILYCLYSLFDAEAILSKSQSPQPRAQSANDDARQMAISQRLSTLVALEALGYDARAHKHPIEVSFQSGNTSGGSGGLVFALEIYNRLTKKDLTRGRIIAATGTLDARGGIGPIEGINYKLKGAQRAGASVILVPAGNLHEIDRATVNLEVIPVESFNDALNALQK